MKTFPDRTRRLVALALFAAAAVAQTNSNAPTIAVRSGQTSAWITSGGFGFTGGFIGATPLTPVIGRPYSAEQLTEHVQTLADGTHITQTTQKVMLYRDSEGRTRTERYFMPPAGAVMVSGPMFVEIADPVAGYRYMLDQNNHVARRSSWPPVMQRLSPTASRTSANSTGSAVLTSQMPSEAAPTKGTASALPPATSTRPHPDMQRESLGTQTIEGIAAEGTRFTTTFPEGFMGNDRPITTVGNMDLARPQDGRSVEDIGPTKWGHHYQIEQYLAIRARSLFVSGSY